MYFFNYRSCNIRSRISDHIIHIYMPKKIVKETDTCCLTGWGGIRGTVVACWTARKHAILRQGHDS